MVKVLAAASLSSLVSISLADLLVEPEVKRASEGQHALSIAAVDFLNLDGVQTRGWNGGIPGPTFRVEPGETLKIQLQNDLDIANYASCEDTGGEFCDVTTTNLHTHGLHVSPKGSAEGLAAYSDDIFATLAPGETQDYEFAIPAYHMGGTHWYHPHHHHATALQAGGGAAGVLVVEDPAGYLPSEFADMEERILMISGHNLVTLQDMAISSQSNLLSNVADAATAAGLDTDIFLVNGQMGPEMELASHTWYRFRMVFAAVEQGVRGSFTGDATCEMKLMAKDGVYLHTLPRDISTVVLSSGSRADVAVSCTCETYPCTATFGSEAEARRRLQRGRGEAGDGNTDPDGDAVTVDLIQVTVYDSGADSTATLPEVTLTRPCYLADLQSASIAEGNSGALTMAGGARAILWNGEGESMTYENVHGDGLTMYDWPALTTFTAGSLHEMIVTGANAHPLHTHVVPFQIISMPEESYDDGYFQVGDWHDTLMIESMGGGSEVTVRLNMDYFTGKMTVHCHILEHEDEGMMSYITIDGTEGDTYSAISDLDSTCYNTAYSESLWI